ncbi:hypothetical protein [Thermodesulfovibrio sp.]|uniref:hypothetical protein n=1 Tax=Thermodesulfovibrio sp. TaxID=2067987 RepID=UPI003C7AFC30
MKKHASRVFFEDAYLAGNPEDALMPASIPQILSGPKPTSFQHYLEQRPENLKDHPKSRAHYNSDNPIRGYKLYWHKDGTGWEEVEISYDEKEFNELLKKHLIRKDNTSKIKEFKEAFEKYIISNAGEEISSLWETPRLKELKKMLDFTNKPENNATEYLELSEFRKRKVLPKPTKVE